MKCLFTTLPVAALLLAWATARGEPATAVDPQAVRRLVATMRAPTTTAERLRQAVADLAAVGPVGLTELEGHVGREAKRLTGLADGRPKTGPLDEEIESLRTTLRRLREEPELSKEQLKTVGLPALEALTVAWGRREAVVAPWRKKQELARGQAERLAAVLAAWQASGGGGQAEALVGQIVELQGRLAPDDAQAARVFAENDVLAKGLPAELVPGMTAVNTIRLTCGLSPLVFDPKLCEVAAMHSRDMESHGFFAHESPLPGKETPWDRAKLAGTTASGENIYKGSTVGSDAIKAWFLSPGHHKNMFGEGHTRQGLGRAGKYWTQLFGAE